MEQKREKLVKYLESKGYVVQILEYFVGSTIHVTLPSLGEQMSYGGARVALERETEILSNIINKEFNCTFCHTDEKVTETMYPKTRQIEFISHFQVL